MTCPTDRAQRMVLYLKQRQPSFPGQSLTKTHRHHTYRIQHYISCTMSYIDTISYTILTYDLVSSYNILKGGRNFEVLSPGHSRAAGWIKLEDCMRNRTRYHVRHSICDIVCFPCHHWRPIDSVVGRVISAPWLPSLIHSQVLALFSCLYCNCSHFGVPHVQPSFQATPWPMTYSCVATF